MQKSPKWRRKPAQRPHQILQAALHVFGETGVATATLDQIAARAGVSKGTIYLYFPNKEELFRQTIRHALAPVSVEPTPPAPGTATRQLLDTVARQWEFLTSEHAVVVSRLVNSERWQFPDLAQLYAREVFARFTGELSAIIRRGIGAGEFRDLDPSIAGRMLTAIAVQSAAWRATAEDPLLAGKSSEVVLSELSAFYLQAIASFESAFPQADGAPDLRGALNS